MYTIDPSLVSISPSSLVDCDIKLDILHENGNKIDGSIFSFDKELNTLNIFTRERSREGYYPLKIVARASDVETAFQVEHSFGVATVDRCKEELRG